MTHGWYTECTPSSFIVLRWICMENRKISEFRLFLLLVIYLLWFLKILILVPFMIFSFHVLPYSNIITFWSRLVSSKGYLYCNLDVEPPTLPHSVHFRFCQNPSMSTRFGFLVYVSGTSPSSMETPWLSSEHQLYINHVPFHSTMLCLVSPGTSIISRT